MKRDQFKPGSTGPDNSPRANLNDSSNAVKYPANDSNETLNCSTFPVSDAAPVLICAYESEKPGCAANVGTKNGSASTCLANSEAARALPRIDSSALSNISSSFMAAAYEFRHAVNAYSNHIQTLEQVLA